MALFENLTARLSPHGRYPARPRPHHRGKRRREPARSAHGAARGRRGVAGGQDLHRARQAEGAGRRSHRQPVARPGLRRHPAQGAGGAHGRPCVVEERTLRAARAAAGRGVVSRPAGRGQDHHRRQAGALAARTEEARVVSQHRYSPSGGRAAAAAPRRAGGRGILSHRRQAGSGATSRARRSKRRARACTTR